jgi:hypothetical protein
MYGIFPHAELMYFTHCRYWDKWGKVLVLCILFCNYWDTYIMEKISKLIQLGLLYFLRVMRKVFVVMIMVILSFLLLYSIKTVMGINLFEDLSIVDFLEFFLSLFQDLLQ